MGVDRIRRYKTYDRNNSDYWYITVVHKSIALTNVNVDSKNVIAVFYFLRSLHLSNLIPTIVNPFSDNKPSFTDKDV